MKIGIILVNYNGSEDTNACLESLVAIDHDSFDINTILVDNNSSKPLGIEEKDYQQINLKIIRSNKNLGFSGGNNLGIKSAMSKNCEFILVLNNDTIQKPDFLVELIKGFENSSVGLVSPKIYFSKGREFHKDRYSSEELGKVIWYGGGTLDMKNILASHRGVDEVDRGQFSKEVETDFATGCCVMIKKEVLEKIGLFDERYFLYLEDLDLSVRAKKAGYKILFAPKSIIWHKNAGSTGGSGSSLQDYFYSRNRMLFGSKFANLRARIALYRESLKLLIKGRPMQRIGIRDYYLRRFGKGSINV